MPENRKHNRLLVTVQPKGKFQVIHGDLCHDIFAVKDISLSGIRVEMGVHLDMGEKILVQYLHGKTDLKVDGTVAWNSASSDDGDEEAGPGVYVIGIELFGAALLGVFL